MDAEALLRTDITGLPNLQRLMRRALQAWKGHLCMAVEREARRRVIGGRRMIDYGHLSLCGPGFAASLASSRKDLDAPAEYEAPLLAEGGEWAGRFVIP
ncbi:hypothetical protein POD33_00090 [Streptomyces moderatus]|nr:hypothetical protein POD33_00090 [Streptomyces moderatus]